jgi:FAD synthetase
MYTNKIISINKATSITKELHGQNKRVVLVGGCFDILHSGHIAFLTKAKEQGEILMLLLESDERIKKLKGSNRPINNQQDRALVLSHLGLVDYVILLPKTMQDTDYAQLVILLKPAIIATTTGDPYQKQKEQQARNVNAKVVPVMVPLTNQSTTRLITFLDELWVK